jgi:hypothetical protein
VDRLDVTQPDPDRLRFVVRVDPERGTTSEHTVTVSDRTLSRLGAAYPSPVAFVEACFRFLLAREPNTSILRSFDVDDIRMYFPEFPDEIAAAR